MKSIKRVTAWKAKGDGRDTVTLADGMIRIVVKQVRGQEVQLLISAPKDIDIKLGETNGNKINNDSSVTMER